MTLTPLVDGPIAGVEVSTDLHGIWVSFPEYSHCGRPGCLVAHFVTHEYWLRGPQALRWYRSFTWLGAPWAESEPDR